MPEPEDHVRQYAEAAEQAVPPTDLSDVKVRRSRRPRWLFVAAATVLVLAAGAVLVGLDRGERVEEVSADRKRPRVDERSTSAPEPQPELPFGLTRCPADPVRPTAAPELYKDEPVYVGNEMPVDEVRAWAQPKPGFQSIWIDRSHNGWITVAFSRDADQRQQELEQEFPGVGVVAVSVDWDLAELGELRSDAEAAINEAGLDNWSSSIDETSGVVQMGVGVLSEERLASLAPFAGQPLCVEGIEPEDAIPDGPQPTEGDGWRLLGSDRTGQAYRTGIATTGDQYQALWDAAGLTGERPAVDFETEVVVWFGAVYGSGCEVRMDDVVSNLDEQLVHGEFVVPGSPMVCNDDARPKAYVVALERVRLPEAPFAIQLDAEDPPGGVPEERTLVSVDLRSPGSVATDDQIGPDPDLPDG